MTSYRVWQKFFFGFKDYLFYIWKKKADDGIIGKGNTCEM